MDATSGGRAVASSLLAALVIANAAGHALDLCARHWWFDRVLHACTIFAVTLWLALFVCRHVLRGGRGAPLVPVIAGVGPAIGALWKAAEWGFDRIAPGDVVKGGNDATIDIVMDTLGALAAGPVGAKSLRPEGAAGPEGARRPPAAPPATPEAP